MTTTWGSYLCMNPYGEQLFELVDQQHQLAPLHSRAVGEHTVVASRTHIQAALRSERCGARSGGRIRALVSFLVSFLVTYGITDRPFCGYTGAARST